MLAFHNSSNEISNSQWSTGKAFGSAGDTGLPWQRKILIGCCWRNRHHSKNNGIREGMLLAWPCCYVNPVAHWFSFIYQRSRDAHGCGQRLKGISSEMSNQQRQDILDQFQAHHLKMRWHWQVTDTRQSSQAWSFWHTTIPICYWRDWWNSWVGSRQALGMWRGKAPL